MRVRDVMSDYPLIIPEGTSVEYAAGMMRDNHIGFIPIGSKEDVAGVITDRDIAIRVTADCKDPKHTFVQDVMTRDGAYCFEDQDIEEAARIMGEKKIRRLPVLNREEQVVGVITMGDLATNCDNVELAGKVLESISTPALPDLPPVSRAHAGLVQAMS